MVNVAKAQRSRWDLLRYQIAGGVFFGAILPYAVRVLFLQPDDVVALLNQTFVACLFAISLGTWLFRSIRAYPGVEESSYILTSMSVSYALVLSGMLLFRLEYNRGLLIGGYALSVSWFYAVYFNLQRRRRLRIGLIPFGATEQLRELDKAEWVDLDRPCNDVAELHAIAADLRMDLPSEWDRRLADYALQGVPVYHFKHLRESLTGRVELEHLSENNFGSLAPDSAFMSSKHVFDWITALIAAIVLAPAMLALAIAIRLGSPGPAIFKQVRIGYQGRPFTVFKFRTMRILPAGSQDARDAAITRSEDNRITPVGRFLRRSRIDELPQIWNILRGEMSWIGPRPEAEVLSRWYETEISFYRYRHIVRPGLTGWAQVNQGHVADVDEVRGKLSYDFYYIKNFSASLDALIVARTIKTILTGFGSK